MYKNDRKSLLKGALVPFSILSLMWIIHAFNLHYQLHLFQYGVKPRDFSGLIGVLFSPLIHSTKDFSHIINNSAPLLILGWALFYFYKNIAWKVLGLSWVIGGAFVWIWARQGSYHAGMSGVIYSLAFYLFFSGVFRKDVRLMAISLFVVFLYGSMIWGLFPLDPTVSYESHFLGALVGVVLAFFLKEEGATFKEKKYQWEIDEEQEREMENNGYTSISDPESGFIIHYEYKPKEDSKKLD